MNMLFCGDKHLKISRFDLAKQFLNWLTNEVIARKPDVYVCLGDDMDTHSVIRSEIAGELKKHFDAVLDAGIKIIYVLGNHDMYKPNDATYHAFLPYKGTNPNFIVVDTIQDIDGITYVPYQHDFSKFPSKTQSICVAHQTFIGADYGFTRPDTGVDADKVSADIIISGHIHIKQMFGKVIYPGSPYSQSKNDVNQIKGVMLFDSDTFKTKFIETPLPKWRHQEIELSDDNSITEGFNFIKTMTKEDVWMIDVKGPKVLVNSFVESPQFVLAKKEIGFKHNPIYTDKEKKTISIKTNNGISFVMKDYIDKVYSGNIDKKELYEANIKVLSDLNLNT